MKTEERRNGDNSKIMKNLSCFYRAISSAGVQTFNDDLKDNFGNMDLVKRRNMMDMLLKALVTQPSENADEKFVDDITNHLFEQEHNGLGLDLVALNIQRGRDHGIPGYIEYRKICRIGKAESFNDLRSNISPKKIGNIQIYFLIFFLRSFTLLENLKLCPNIQFSGNFKIAKLNF